jgi:hypothetical protein
LSGHWALGGVLALLGMDEVGDVWVHVLGHRRRGEQPQENDVPGIAIVRLDSPAAVSQAACSVP